MKKIITVLIILSVFVTLLCSVDSCAASMERSIDENGQIRYSYLVVGFDDAAENTDAIILFTYELVSNTVDFIQIPRDTLYNLGGRDVKINSIYPSERAKGKEPYEALGVLSASIERALGLPIDGYVGYTIDAFSRLVDNIGGVELELGEDLTYRDSDGKRVVRIPAGTHHLTGEDAVNFVRFRKGYSLGDLGRIDAQKIFLSEFLKKLKNSVNLNTAINMLKDSGEGVVTNCKLLDILNIAMKNLGRISSVYTRYANLPGVSLINEKVSYYICNKVATEKMLREMEIYHSGFDKDKLFLSQKNEEMISAYYAEGVKWKIYDENNLLNMNIP